MAGSAASLDGFRARAETRLIDRARAERSAIWPLVVAILIHLAFFVSWPQPAPNETKEAPQNTPVEVDVVDAPKAPEATPSPEPAPPAPPVPQAQPVPPPSSPEQAQPTETPFPAAVDKPSEKNDAPQEERAPQDVGDKKNEPPSPAKAEPAPPPPPVLHNDTAGIPVPAPPPLVEKPSRPPTSAPKPKPRTDPVKQATKEPATPPSPAKSPPGRSEISTVPAPVPLREAPGSATGLDLPPINYIQQVVGRINQVKTYPEKARIAGQQGVAVVRFTIARSGQIGSVDIVRSSGSSTLDEAALALVRRAAPYPPLPSDFVRPLVTLTLPLSFGLR